MILPVARQTKAENARDRAQARPRGDREKTESQDICFVPDGDHTKIIRKKLGDDTPSLSPGAFMAVRRRRRRHP